MDNFESMRFMDNQDIDLGELTSTQDALLSNIELIINCCWDEGKSLNILARQYIIPHAQDYKDLNSIWTDYEDRAEEIIGKKLDQIHLDAVDNILTIETIISEKIK
jgi:hypothetical protein